MHKDCGRWVLDRDGEPRFASEFDVVDGVGLRRLHYRAKGQKRWKVVGEYEYGTGEIVPIAFAFDNTSVYALSDIGRNTLALYELDSDTMELGRLIYADDVYDIRGVVISKRTKELSGVFYTADKHKIVWLDPERRALADAIRERLPEATSWFQFSDDDRVALVRTSSDRDPGSYWIYRSETGVLRELFKRAEWLVPDELTPIRPIEFDARDGLTIRGYLALPPDATSKPPPLLVNPHGGPFGIRDVDAFDPTVQYFASLGFAVLQVDFRGSGGYGVGFIKAGWREHGGKMIDDITDGVRWTLEQGYADPDRICLYGGSYGGFAALMSLVREPALYKCAISFAGVTDLRRMIGTGSGPGAEWTRQIIGDYFDDKDVLRANSPVHNAGSIEDPVLLIHGKQDRIVHWHHTDRMERALKEAGRPVTVKYYDDEGHTFFEEDDRVEVHGVMAGFLNRYLGEADQRQRP